MIYLKLGLPFHLLFCRISLSQSRFMLCTTGERRARILELKIDKQQKAGLAKAVQDYLVNELDFDVSGLQCEMLLDHVAEVIGPAFYNQGLRDAQAVISRRMDDAAADIDVLEQPLNGR